MLLKNKDGQTEFFPFIPRRNKFFSIKGPLDQILTREGDDLVIKTRDSLEEKRLRIPDCQYVLRDQKFLLIDEKTGAYLLLAIFPWSSNYYGCLKSVERDSEILRKQFGITAILDPAFASFKPKVTTSGKYFMAGVLIVGFFIIVLPYIISQCTNGQTCSIGSFFNFYFGWIR